MEILPTDNVEDEKRESCRGERGRDKIICPKGGELDQEIEEVIDRNSNSNSNFFHGNFLNNFKNENENGYEKRRRNEINNEDYDINENNVSIQSTNYIRKSGMKKRRLSSTDKEKDSITVINLIDSSDSDNNCNSNNSNDYHDGNNINANDNENNKNDDNNNNNNNNNNDNEIYRNEINDNDDFCDIDSDIEFHEFDLIKSSQGIPKRKLKSNTLISLPSTSLSSFKASSSTSFPNFISTATDCKSQPIKNGNREVEKEVEFEYRVILLEDPPHLLQRMYGTDSHFNNSSKGVSTGSGNSRYVLL